MIACARGDGSCLGGDWSGTVLLVKREQALAILDLPRERAQAAELKP